MEPLMQVIIGASILAFIAAFFAIGKYDYMKKHAYE